MYLAQRQQLFFSPNRIPVWQNDGDVFEATLEQLIEMKQFGATVSDSRDSITLIGPSRRVRHLIISETQSQRWELYNALDRR